MISITASFLLPSPTFIRVLKFEREWGAGKQSVSLPSPLPERQREVDGEENLYAREVISQSSPRKGEKAALPEIAPMKMSQFLLEEGLVQRPERGLHFMAQIPKQSLS